MKQHLVELAETSDSLQTPAFIVDEQQLLSDAETVIRSVKGKNILVLFAMKSFSVVPALKSIANVVDGFHVSSLFEAKLARQLLGDKGTIHLTTPGLREDEYNELNELVDYISFNSLSQWRSFTNNIHVKPKCGLRVNPQLSFIEDERYDPCRHASKLGVSLQQLQSVLKEDPEQLKNLSGILFHSNCDATDFSGLDETVNHLEATIQPFLKDLQWINLGGGYLFNEGQDHDRLSRLILHLQDRYGLQLLFEPGASISRKAGYIVSSVVDIFSSDGKQVAVLDTTVNHMPEVFEYQFEPDLVGEVPDGKYEYILAGSTCLAGDLFGVYKLNKQLQLGSRLVFENSGAYTLVKASMFNGVNLPAIYILNRDKSLSLIKHFGFQDYLSLCGAE